MRDGETLEQELGRLEAEVGGVEDAEDDHLVEVAVAPQLGPGAQGAGKLAMFGLMS